MSRYLSHDGGWPATLGALAANWGIAGGERAALGAAKLGGWPAAKASCG
ncbi:MAG: hypothetical protein ACYC5H_17120 [Methylovirgula sp.]